MLQGAKTLIRPLEQEDFDLIYQWYQDPEFVHWVSGGWPLSSFLRRDELEEKFYHDDPYRYAILNESSSLIGTVGFDQINSPARSARIFIGLGCLSDWGQGYGSDALRYFIRYLFEQWNFRRLTAETWDGNKRAEACYLKLGFTLEGRWREAYYIRGNYVDGLCFGLLKKDL